MKRILLGILFLPILAWADNLWINAAGDEWLDSDGYYCGINGQGGMQSDCINISSYKTDNYKGSVQYIVWEKLNFNKPVELEDYSYDQLVQQVLINCKYGEISILQDLRYLQGNIKGEGSIRGFFTPPPGSIGESYLNLACNGDLSLLNQAWNNGTLIKLLNSASNS